MIDYIQPDFYRFNEDSIKLVKFCKNYLSKEDIVVLDACCGCGVIGIELSKYIGLSRLDFIEIQNEYLPYIETNRERFLNIPSNIFIGDITNHSFANQYDLILLNPPYFCSEASRPSSDFNRDIARRYKSGELSKIINSCISNLKREGLLFMVIKEDLDISSELKKVTATYEIEAKDGLNFFIFSSIEGK